MADGVNIPISLTVDRIQIKKSAVDRMTNHLQGISSTVVKDANKLLDGIDPTKMTEKMTKSFDNAVKKITDLNQAIRAYDLAQKQAGKSSTEYRALAKKNTAEIEAEKKAYGNMLSSLIDGDLGQQVWTIFQRNGIGGNPHAGDARYAQFNYLYTSIEELTVKHNETMARLTAETPNPLDFIRMGTETSINALIKAYERAVEAVNEVSKANKQFEQSTQNDQFTKEYNERIAAIQKLIDKMDKLNEKSKKMEQVGASDNAWESLRYDMNQVATELTSLIRGARQLNKSSANMQLGPDPTVMREQSKLLSNLQRKVTALKNAMNTRADRNETPYTKEYAAQLREIEKVRREIDKLAAKEKEMQALGADRAHWDKFAYDVKVLNDRMGEVISKAQDLVDTGKAFKFGGDAEAEMQRLDEEANTLRYTLSKLENTDPNLKTNFFMTLRSMKAVSQMCDKILGKVKNLWKSFTNLFKHANKGSINLAGSFKKLLQKIMMFGLGFRSTYYLVKQLRKVVTEELGYMAKAFPEVNEMMSELKTALNQIKGQFGAAFLPIMQIIVPALETLISVLNRACDAIARFFSILAGKNTYKKFTSDALDYAESLEKASGASKDLKNSVMGFDELNRLNDNTGSGKDNSDDGAQGSWEDAPAVSEFAEMLKSAWANADFTEVGVMLGHKVVDALNTATEWMKTNGQEWARNLGTSVATLINGFFGVNEVGTSIGEAIAAAINMAITNLHTFLSGTDWLHVGTVIGESITTAIENIDWEGLGTTLGDYLRGVIQFAFGIIERIDFDTLGENIAVGINNFLDHMNAVDPVTGLSGWQEAGKSMYDLADGILDALIVALDDADWNSVGEAIGGFLSELDFGNLVIDFANLAIKIVGAIGETLAGWEDTDPISFGIATLLGTALLGVELTSVAAKTGNLLLPLLNQIAQETGKSFPILQNFANLLKGIGGTLSILSGAFLAVTNFISMFTEGFSWAKEAVMLLGIALVAVGLIVMGVAAWPVVIVAAIVAAVATITVIVKEHWAEIVTWLQEAWITIKEWFAKLWIAVKEWFQETWIAVKEWLQNAWIAIKEWFHKVWEFIKKEAETAWRNLKSLFGGIVAFFGGPLVVGLSGAIGAVVGIFKGLWHSIKEIWTDIRKIFNGIITFVKGVFTGNWSQAWEGVKTTFKGIFDALVDIAKAPLNLIIGFINGMLDGISTGVNFIIDKVNGLSFKVPDWVPVIGGKNFGFNLEKVAISNIPYLAKGAVIPPNSEFLAVLGDQKRGTNIEAPLDTIIEAIREAFPNGGPDNNAPIVVQVMLDKRVLGETMVQFQNQRNRAFG